MRETVPEGTQLLEPRGRGINMVVVVVVTFPSLDIVLLVVIDRLLQVRNVLDGIGEAERSWVLWFALRLGTLNSNRVESDGVVDGVSRSVHNLTCDSGLEHLLLRESEHYDLLVSLCIYSPDKTCV